MSTPSTLRMSDAELLKAMHDFIGGFTRTFPRHTPECAYRVSAREGTPGPCNCVFGSYRRDAALLIQQYNLR